MKPLPQETRERILKIYDEAPRDLRGVVERGHLEGIASRFGVTKNTIATLVWERKNGRKRKR